MNHQKLSESMLEIAEESFSSARWFVTLAILIALMAGYVTGTLLVEWDLGVCVASVVLWVVGLLFLRLSKTYEAMGDEFVEKAYKLRGGK